MKRETTLFGEQ